MDRQLWPSSLLMFSSDGWRHQQCVIVYVHVELVNNITL